MPFRFNPLTDRLDLVDVTAIPPGVLLTLTGNSGGAVGPSGGGNINILGAGVVTVAGNAGTNTLTISINGTVATTYTADTGSATPAANNLNLLTSVVAAGTAPFASSGAGSTITHSIQRTQAAAVSAANIVGLAAFLNTQFSVDANGFVSLNGSGVGQTITGDTGGPLSPTAGNWNILGSSPAAGTNPVQTTGAGSTLTVNVQKSQAIGATNAANVGLAAFNSSHFSVDANGFVSLAGGGQAIDSIAVQTGTSPVVPTAAGLVTFNGAVVAAGTNPVRTDGTGANTYALEVQISQAIASTNANNIGLAAFNSAHFTVDANGFVSSLGGGFPWTDQGTSITVSANNGYFATAAVTLTLPASPTQGQVVKIICDTASTVVVAANTGQTIRQGTIVSSSAGSFTNTARGDALELIYRAATTQWIALNGNGVWVAA